MSTVTLVHRAGRRSKAGLKIHCGMGDLKSLLGTLNVPLC